MKLTISQIKDNDHISTEEINQDIIDTQNEINDYQDEKDVLMRNPQENRTRIYLLDGKIKQRIDFISKLNQIIDYRKGKNDNS